VVTNYIGEDVDCKMTELAVECKGRIIARDRVPTDVKFLNNFLGSIDGKKEMVVDEGQSSQGVPEALFLKLFQRTGQALSSQASPMSLRQGRPVKVVNGATCPCRVSSNAQ
jgi:hypothetical protein